MWVVQEQQQQNDKFMYTTGYSTQKRATPTCFRFFSLLIRLLSLSELNRIDGDGECFVFSGSKLNMGDL